LNLLKNIKLRGTRHTRLSQKRPVPVELSPAKRPIGPLIEVVAVSRDSEINGDKREREREREREGIDWGEANIVPGPVAILDLED